MGVPKNSERSILAVVDTGIGPDLIREGCCPAEAIKKRLLKQKL